MQSSETFDKVSEQEELEEDAKAHFDEPAEPKEIIDSHSQDNKTAVMATKEAQKHE